MERFLERVTRVGTLIGTGRVAWNAYRNGSGSMERFLELVTRVGTLIGTGRVAWNALLNWSLGSERFWNASGTELERNGNEFLKNAFQFRPILRTGQKE